MREVESIVGGASVPHVVHVLLLAPRRQIDFVLNPQDVVEQLLAEGRGEGSHFLHPLAGGSFWSQREVFLDSLVDPVHIRSMCRFLGALLHERGVTERSILIRLPPH